MKTMIIAFASLALLSTASFAKDRCMPSTGNWVNAATISCPDQGSGGVGFTTREHNKKCEYKRG